MAVEQPTGFDRRLVELVSDLTDEGQVMPLDHALHMYGPQLTERVVADGFAVIRHNSDVELSGLDDASFLPAEEARAIVRGSIEAWDHVIVAGPWAPIALEDEPNLIFEYCADDPEAVAEVRRRNAERRQSLGFPPPP